MAQKYVPVALRRLVRERAAERCEYCLIPEQLTLALHWVDHVVAEKHGGRTEEGNLALSCVRCNDHKNDRIADLDPLTGELVRLFDPRPQVWAEHFEWSAEGDRILGKTPTGRATVTALNLNRPSLVIARRLWVSVGWHPPKD